MGLPFLASDAAAAPGYRPACKVEAAVSGGGGGLLDMAASLLGASQADPWAEHLRGIDLVSAPAPFLDTCRIELSGGDGAPEVALGDKLNIKLGYGDSLNPVFSGEVAAIAGGDRRGLTLRLASPALALARLRQNASFEQRGLGDLLRAWAGEAGLAPGSLDGGPDLPFLAVDDRRSAWEWIAELARLAGLMAWVDGEGKLHCKAPGGAPARTYRYGQDILSLAHDERVPALGEVTVNGEGAAGGQGSQAWSWLAKDPGPIRAGAGASPPKRLVRHGALRNHAAVAAMAAGLDAMGSRLAKRVAVSVPGSAELGVGALFSLAGCPGGRGDGDWLVLRLRHRYARRLGFVTELDGIAP